MDKQPTIRASDSPRAAMPSTVRPKLTIEPIGTESIRLTATVPNGPEGQKIAYDLLNMIIRRQV